MNVKVNDQYQITLPHDLCKKLEIQAGDDLLMDVQGSLLILIPQPKDYVAHMDGLYVDVWKNVDTAAYLDKERKW